MKKTHLAFSALIATGLALSACTKHDAAATNDIALNDTDSADGNATTDLGSLDQNASESGNLSDTSGNSL